jgi:alpha-D-ribose 1-methylphosphonate 5-triphosphate synthase subunit PhnG
VRELIKDAVAYEKEVGQPGASALQRTGARSRQGSQGASSSSHCLQVGQNLSVKLLPIAVMVNDIGHGQQGKRMGTQDGGELFKLVNHRLHHTRASCLIQNGTPLYDLQKMGGWKSAHMARHAAVVDGLLRVTNTAQSVEEGIQKKASRSLVTP